MNRRIRQPRHTLRICRRKACQVKASQVEVINSSRCPVAILSAPKITLLARFPVMATVACCPIGAYAARKGGISVMIVASDIKTTVRWRCFRPRLSPLLPAASAWHDGIAHTGGVSTGIPPA